MDILAFVAELAALQAHVEHGQSYLEKAGEVVEKEAKSAIGTYKYGWPPLAPETVTKKGADTPLLETGEMRDSIGHRLDGDHAVVVGSDNKKAVYHELGTPTIPPRSFLVSAAMEKEAEVVEILGSPLSKAPMIERK